MTGEERTEAVAPGVDYAHANRGALARGAALVWGLPEWWRVVRTWGNRCVLAEYDDGSTRCAKCSAVGFKSSDDDD